MLPVFDLSVLGSYHGEKNYLLRFSIVLFYLPSFSIMTYLFFNALIDMVVNPTKAQIVNA